ncbi:hypothetical protein TRV_02017 [Trichophyton verrucosum HKI 0517]|uniref:Uncharacterized protein n=1 Tax=Trichophyton verrucosum (strain HKI 0517) TaxID=663202 RepID=D4D4K0_TRIVH|nr:uncharacterized protein TRV_02017 [Trichophyton verrucosum HKI 0517]EFE43202.1 hypothetical protein TRV_02017 [Trichophyton verrucosum HKI 0517]
MGAGEQYRTCSLFGCDLLSDAISFEAAEPAEPHERRIVYEDTEEVKTGIGDKLGPRRCWARAAETRGRVSSGGRSIVAGLAEGELVFAIYRAGATASSWKSRDAARDVFLLIEAEQKVEKVEAGRLWGLFGWCLRKISKLRLKSKSEEDAEETTTFSQLITADRQEKKKGLDGREARSEAEVVQAIDELLERYLHLLDEQQKLQEAIGKQFASVRGGLFFFAWDYC